MASREKILESLLELSDRSSTDSKARFVDRLVHTAIKLADADGVATVLSIGRQIERWTYVRDEFNSTCHEVPRGNEFGRMLFRAHNPIIVADVSSEARTYAEDGCPGIEAGPAVFVPLRPRGQNNGYLAVYRKRGAPFFNAEEIRLVTFLGAWAAMAVQNMRLSESLERLAVTDDLTQIYNYRFLKTALRREVKRAARYQQNLGIVMIDVDNLKEYNDRFGHLRGSYLLREMAGLFAGQIRPWDLVAKYGGDEFTLLLPQTGREGSIAVAERMRAAVENHMFPLAERGAITISLGISVFPEDAEDSIGLLRAADRALYSAKRAGRNRVEASEVKAA
jgi:diguanylate cyclase (GGDEF)-like protein